MTRTRALAALLTALLLLGLTGSSASARWHPKPGRSFQWQLQGKLDLSVNAHVYDIDGFDASRKQVHKLHDKGRKVICYISAGTWENWRPDADDFPDEVLGKSNGWPGEKWLDVRRLGILRPIMRHRLRMCARKGFDGVEFDNVDGYTNDTGFPLTGSDQKRYNRWLAHAAHKKGLAAGLKNDLEQIPALEPAFDFAVNEQCFQYNECGHLMRFINNDKAVFHVEYELKRSEFCPQARDMHFSSLKKRYSLKAWRRPC